MPQTSRNSDSEGLIYLNDVQRDVMAVQARTTVLCAGRAFGRGCCKTSSKKLSKSLNFHKLRLF